MEYLVVNYLPLKRIIQLFSQIEIDAETGCWNWVGTLTDGGYGKTFYDGRTELAHRLFYAWLVESLPMGRSADIPNIDHIVCDNEACCNPVHMKLGPQRDNILRGTSVSAVNARKTHCDKGHPLVEGHRQGERMCKICRAEWAKNYVNDTPEGQQRRAIMRERSRLWMIGYRERKRKEQMSGQALSSNT